MQKKEKPPAYVGRSGAIVCKRHAVGTIEGWAPLSDADRAVYAEMGIDMVCEICRK